MGSFEGGGSRTDPSIGKNLSRTLSKPSWSKLGIGGILNNPFSLVEVESIGGGFVSWPNKSRNDSPPFRNDNPIGNDSRCEFPRLLFVWSGGGVETREFDILLKFVSPNNKFVDQESTFWSSPFPNNSSSGSGVTVWPKNTTKNISHTGLCDVLQRR